MFFQTDGQFLILLACIFGGACIGLLYDLLHGFGAVKLSPWLNAFLDIAFVCGAAAIFLAVTYLSTFGAVRLYTLAGFLLGFWAEQFSLKIYVAKLLRAVYNYIVKITAPLRVRRKRRAEKLKERRKEQRKLRARQKRKERTNDRIAI